MRLDIPRRRLPYQVTQLAEKDYIWNFNQEFSRRNANC
jgi:hypothetical protein